MGNIKRSTAGDFRINAASLEAALREIESEEEEEDGDDEDDGRNDSVNGHDNNNRSNVKEVLVCIIYILV